MDSRIRHITKSITWRVIATSTTFTLTLLFFGKAEMAKASWLAFFETSIKILIYYVHERIWFKLSTKLSHKLRHILKAFTWRLVASGTTFILALIFFAGHEDAMEKATWIAIIESVLKMAFYYGHEEAWYRINLGLDNREKNKSSS
ncbi:MAG: DUF2061 domain-containing protein [Reichenbachiella sp.]